MFKMITAWMLLFFLPVGGFAGQSNSGRFHRLSLRKIFKTGAHAGFPLVLHALNVAPGLGGHWVAGASLDCSDMALISMQGKASVVCVQYGSQSHGMTCENFSVENSQVDSGLLCSEIYTPDEAAHRDCTQVLSDIREDSRGAICYSFGDDASAPHCTRRVLARQGEVENLICQQMYCPACLDHNHTHYWIRHEGPLGPVEAGELIEPCADSFAEGSQLTLSAESTSEQVGQASGIAVGAPQKAGSADAAESSPVPKKASRSFLRGYVGDGDNDEL